MDCGLSPPICNESTPSRDTTSTTETITAPAPLCHLLATLLFPGNERTTHDGDLANFLLFYRCLFTPQQLVVAVRALFAERPATAATFAAVNALLVTWVEQCFAVDFVGAAQSDTLEFVLELSATTMMREQANALRLSCLKRKNELEQRRALEHRQTASTAQQRVASGVNIESFVHLRPRQLVSEGKRGSSSGARACVLDSIDQCGLLTRWAFFVDVPAKVLAQQLTLDDYGVFANVALTEFVGHAWQSQERQRVAPRLHELTQRFNRVAGWVSSEVLCAPTAKARVAFVHRACSTLKHLLRLRNYHSLMAVYTGLTVTAVSRLHRTLWSKVKKKKLSVLERVAELMSPLSNFAAYRREVSRSSSSSSAAAAAAEPRFPYVPVFLRDLVFASDGNPSFIDDGSTATRRVNFDKMRVVGTLIADFKRHQHYRWPIEAYPELAGVLNCLFTIDNEALYRLSLRIEPLSASSASSGNKSLSLRNRQPSTIALQTTTNDACSTSSLSSLGGASTVDASTASENGHDDDNGQRFLSTLPANLPDWTAHDLFAWLSQPSLHCECLDAADLDSSTGSSTSDETLSSSFDNASRTLLERGVCGDDVCCGLTTVDLLACGVPLDRISTVLRKLRSLERQYRARAGVFAKSVVHSSDQDVRNVGSFNGDSHC